jgi:hypothetical protein
MLRGELPGVLGLARGLLLKDERRGSNMMGPRERKRAVHRQSLCIVMTCNGLAEAAEVSKQFSQVNTGSLVTYRRAEDVLLNSPRGRVALIILADSDDPERLERTLAWMRHRWPHAPIVVIGERGGGQLELAARAGGASFLARPVRSDQWAAMIMHVLKLRRRVATEERLG